MSAVALERPQRLRAVAAPEATEDVVVPSGRMTLVLALATVLVIVLGVFGIVGLNAMAANSAVDARALERQVEREERRYAELLVAVTAKEDPARIRAQALEMGLVPAAAARHLVVARGIDADGQMRADARADVSDPLKPVLTQGR
jgi:hypothetical protein